MARAPSFSRLAELIVIGGLFSTLAFLGLLALASPTDWIDTDALTADGADYVIRHPIRGLSFVLVGLAVAYAGAFAVARWVAYRNYPPRIGLGSSAWHRMLVPVKPDHAAYATVDLRDGTTICGWVQQVTTGEVPLAERDLVLLAALGTPLKVRPPKAATFVESPDQAIVLNGADVLTVSASYYSMADRRKELRAFNEEIDRVLAQFAADETEEGRPPKAPDAEPRRGQSPRK